MKHPIATLLLAVALSWAAPDALAASPSSPYLAAVERTVQKYGDASKVPAASIEWLSERFGLTTGQIRKDLWERAPATDLIDSVVRQAAAQLNLPRDAGLPPAITQPTPFADSRFVHTSTAGTLAEALGMKTAPASDGDEPTAMARLVNIQGRRGRHIRRLRRSLYQEALSGLLAEYRRVTLVPHETVLELARLTGRRPESVRKDLIRVVATATE